MRMRKISARSAGETGHVGFMPVHFGHHIGPNLHHARRYPQQLQVMLYTRDAQQCRTDMCEDPACVAVCPILLQVGRDRQSSRTGARKDTPPY